MRNAKIAILILLLAAFSMVASVYAEDKGQPATKILIKKTEPRTVAVMKHKGPFTDISTVMPKLIGEVDRGGYAVAGPVMCMFFNSPENTAQADLLWEVMIPVAYPGPLGQAQLDRMTFQYSDVATVAYTYHIGPYEKINDTYKLLFDWARRNQYKTEGNPVDIYWSDQAKTPKEKLVTEVWLPVEEKKVPGIAR
jgi:effector-binding domain-containing protein